MYKVIYWKSGEVLIETIDEDIGDISDCFYNLDGRDVYLTVGADRISDLQDVKKIDDPIDLEVPEGYRAHEIIWRFIEFDVILKDEDYVLTGDDFSYREINLCGYTWRQLVLDEEIGELEFNCASDGISDEDIDD